jgi:hypothetical protein
MAKDKEVTLKPKSQTQISGSMIHNPNKNYIFIMISPHLHQMLTMIIICSVIGPVTPVSTDQANRVKISLLNHHAVNRPSGRNSGSLDHDHFIMIISSLGIRPPFLFLNTVSIPRSEYGLHQHVLFL